MASTLLIRALKGAVKFAVISAATPVAMVVWLTPVRFLNVNVSRIGHLISEPDCFLKEGILGLRPRVWGVICAPSSSIFPPSLRVCNRAIAEVWGQRITVVTGALPCLLLAPLWLHPWLIYNVKPYMVAYGKTARFIDINVQWGNRPSLFSLPSTFEERGERRLRELGIPDKAWFVCLHNREGEYAPHDEHWHSYRNCSITSFQLATEEITTRGGWVIRMGDSSMSIMPPWRNAIDYAHHPLHSDWMDIFLISRCRFFLGNSSGPFYLATIVGIPVALTNLVPLSMLYQAVGEKHLGIPKLTKCIKSNAILPASRIMGSEIGNYRFSEQFRDAALQLIDNSPEEIQELACEMLDRIENKIFYSDEDEAMQKVLRELFTPGDYSYGGTSRVGRSFLTKHANVMLS